MRSDTNPAGFLHDGPATVRRGGAIVMSDGDAALLLRFSGEVRAAAISCLNLLSCFNAVGLAQYRPLPQRLGAFKPSQPLSFHELRASALADLFKPATCAGLKGFALFLATSGDELEQVLRGQLDAGVVSKAMVERASDAAATAACFAKITLKDLVAIHRRLFREFDVAECSYLASLLDDVLQGKSPLLVDGQLVGVKTDFEIRDVRVELNAEAFVAGAAMGDRVLVRNISQGGLGFDGTARFCPSQLVEIRLTHSGRKLQGRVVWKVGTKAGVEFLTRLDEADALLQT